MHGLMMDTPLSITSLMRFADAYHPQREIVSITADNPLHRTTYGEAFRRTRQLANGRKALGIEGGGRVAAMRRIEVVALRFDDDGIPPTGWPSRSELRIGNVIAMVRTPPGPKTQCAQAIEAHIRTLK